MREGTFEQRVWVEQRDVGLQVARLSEHDPGLGSARPAQAGRPHRPRRTGERRGAVKHRAFRHPRPTRRYLGIDHVNAHTPAPDAPTAAHLHDRATLEVDGVAADIRDFWGLLLMSSATRTLGWLCDEYLRFKVLAPESCTRYLLSAKNLARHMHGANADATSVPLQSITADVLIAFRDDSRQRMRPASVNTERRHLSTLLNFACRQGCLERNPYRDVPSIPTPQTGPRGTDSYSVGRRFESYRAHQHPRGSARE